MRHICHLGWALALLLGVVGSAVGQEEKLAADVLEARASFEKSDAGIKKFFETAQGYALFPRIGKGAVGIGAAHGKGQVFEKGKVIGESKLTQITLGVQLGGQVYAEVVFFETSEALQRFKEGKFALSAQASAVAAAEGAAANAKYEQGVAIFTLVQSGLMFEASVGGQKFSYKPYH